ncbi:MAG: hypothetical protein E6G27_05665 [Actinobacteria bacterium]|nr:MAG: hypothetical protein E6G27_05665 [Actinomycetota bacterium]
MNHNGEVRESRVALGRRLVGDANAHFRDGLSVIVSDGDADHVRSTEVIFGEAQPEDEDRGEVCRIIVGTEAFETCLEH